MVDKELKPAVGKLVQKFVLLVISETGDVDRAENKRTG